MDNYNFFLNIKKPSFILFLIIASSFVIDKIYLLNISYLPAWDQGYHFSNLFRTYNFLESFIFNSEEWWKSFWSISETYRGPLTYIFSSFFLKFFGKSYESGVLSNNIYTIITILCIFNICRENGNKKAGLWGALIFAFNPYIFDQRVDYLNDISQICFINLNFYILYKFFKSNGSFLISSILGITLGFIFLTKPTGIFLICFPYILTFYFLIKSNIYILKKVLYLIIFCFTFIITIWPWLSINWLTIVTSIVNSWQWGIKYQDGLEANTLEGILFYPKTIIKLIGPFIFGSCFVIATLKIFSKFKKSTYKKKYSNILSKNNIFLLSLPVNILIICTLMSTKDLRFILPIFPSLSICLGLFITSFKNYNWVKFYKLFIFTIILLKLILHLSLQINTVLKSENSSKYYWPHKEIIDKVRIFSPYTESIIAILPDTKELNTFNLAAEANLQNSDVFIRQIISNEDSYKDDIDRFNWFLLKNGDQGVMFSKTKLALSNLVKSSNKFVNFKSWELPDGSQANLFKRKIINESVSIINNNFVPLNLELLFSSNGISANLKGNSEILSDSNLLIDARNNGEKYEINIALPKIKNLSKKNIEIIKNFYYEEELKLNDSFEFNCILISKNNRKVSIPINQISYQKKIKNSSEEKFEINKINEVEKMGNFLKNGDFEKLFNLVSLVNQSDPNQEYLKDAEQIFKYRYKLNKRNLDYLYNIAISQILQKKSTEASISLNELMKYEKNNSNLYLAKAIVDIYNFNPKQAEKNIEIADELNKTNNLNSTINTIKIISKVINFKIISLLNK